MFGWFGRAALVVRDGVLHAGTAYISVELLGTPEPLDAAGTRRVLGVEDEPALVDGRGAGAHA